VKKKKMNEGNINADDEEVLESNRRIAEDGGWGRIRGNNDSTRAMKTKGSWAFARRTISCNTAPDPPATTEPDPPAIRLPFLTVLAAEQVAKIISDKDMLQLAPIHAELIRKTGLKRKTEKESGECSPTEVEKRKKKYGESKNNQLDNYERKALSDNTIPDRYAKMNKECNDNNDKIGG
jgi:hypothetical protein